MIELYPEMNQIDEQKNALAGGVGSIADAYVDGDEKYFPLGNRSLEFKIFSIDFINICFFFTFKFY
jgi:hypothetical protein